MSTTNEAACSADLAREKQEPSASHAPAIDGIVAAAAGDLQPEVLRIEMESTRHAMRHLQRSQKELQEELDAEAQAQSPDEEYRQTLQEARDENWGVLARQMERHNRIADELAKKLGIEPGHFRITEKDLGLDLPTNQGRQPAAQPDGSQQVENGNYEASGLFL
ncbi:hypothetical protein K437DRAFT_87959 [Tilletiaria anomala UBC 951]|uniref:Uncharacterized protein n=1 Tax=Tilletiaria anomala (strain ATCC 24038 / CBS 436.72 / UBC 951) TaxID=1037660 RepID=A0A066W2J0_TILAU|nr:uncharacterized protein K437DRAFT_87959 [Tilletiaria anomala UBC 951]KDN48192.1 hypothetical protein K437DRAFT_87959 [Tilletiaria anomala UBC 951]